ncbi:MAG: type II secretion system F family protein [Endomicrobium sp.]|jgi:tight adherence protein B|nr:type II secretion system F family protein [Endomicrobium sp.]
MNTSIFNLLFLISAAAAVFCFIFYAANLIANKKKSENNKENPSKINFKTLPALKKRFLFSFIIFFIISIIIQNLIFAFIAAVLYAYFDWYVQDRKLKKRMELIDKQVIEALTVIKNSVQSGQSIQAAMGIAYEELKEPVKSEFETISKNLALGVNFDEVLKKAAENSLSKEFRLMIDTIKLSKDSGSSLSGVFDRIIDATSQRISIQLKINALTAQGRMSGNIVSLMPFIVVLMMYLIDPDMIKSLFVTFVGNVLLLISVILVLTGSFVIRKMTEIDF